MKQVCEVLLVEDDPEMPRVLSALLEGDGVCLSSARNAPQALEVVRRKPFDLILLDLGLPGINGLDLLRHLKEAPDTEGIPVIILTAWNSTADKLRGFDLGAVDYLTKPYEAAELRARLRAALRAKVLQDELTAANRELTAARTAAEGNARAKAEFLAQMSHEIRTPMNGITSMAELLLESGLTADQQGMVETIHGSAQSLLRIINDILDFSRVESGRLELERQCFDLRLCVEGALDLLAAKASEKGLELVYQLQDNVPGEVVGDATRLRQVLVNLLSNAVKFTETGEVVLQVRSAGRQEGEEAGLHFSVRDTGIGIPESRMARLFQQFSQADASTARHYGGSGLGLAISKRLVELMGGRMWVESVAGKGSTFHFTVSLPAGRGGCGEVDRVEPRLTGVRALIVDDNATNGRIFMMQLSRWGMLPRSTQNAEQALEWVEQGERFDVALVDLEMKGMDGSTLARELKARSKELPIVLLMPIGGKVPMNGDCPPIACFLTKPVKRGQLRERLVQVVSGVRSPGRVPGAGVAAAAAVAPRPVERSLAERLPLRVLLCDDNAVNQKVAVRLLRQLGYAADVAGNGLEALRLMEGKAYDVVFMDVMMPEMGGFEATEEIRRRQQDRVRYPSFKHPLVVIAMTANAMQGDRERCLGAGMDDYLSKPVRLEDIRGVLERWGALAGREEAEVQGQNALEENAVEERAVVAEAVHARVMVMGPEDGNCPVDMQRLGEFTDNNVDNLRELTELYLRQTGEQLRKLEEAVRTGRVDEVRRLAHSSAGASATCGMRSVVGPLKELERQGYEGRLVNAEIHLARAQHEFGRVRDFLGEWLKV